MTITNLTKKIAQSTLLLSIISLYVANVNAAEIIDDRFEIIENGSQVRDLKTKLIWQRCSVGQKWEGSVCKGKPKSFIFNDTNQLANNGWRVPEKDELLSIVDGTVDKVTINQKAFPNTPASDFWTSTHYVFTPNAWLVNFDYGLSSYANASHSCFIRLVKTSE